MSARISVADVLRFTGGSLAAGDASGAVRGVGIDSRNVTPGQLFIAIRGPHHDGHAFLDAALEAGAGGLLVERGVEHPAPATAPIVAVDDTTRALSDLAAGHRAAFGGPVIAITGSNGKTTTKEMCAAIVSAGRSCLKTEGNLNNQFGLPLTLLRREPRHDALVVELGTNHPGEIAALAAVARPSVGAITNVGTAHIEFLGSREGIAREKGALFAALGTDAVAIANADDDAVVGQLARTRARQVRFGRCADADVRAEALETRGAHGYAFELAAPEGRVKVSVAGIGEATVSNALAAAACALAAGSSLEDVAIGLAQWRPVGGRLAPSTLANGTTLLDDTYNANPQSVALALESLATLKGRARGFAVLGDMGELGEHTLESHRESGRLAADLAIDELFALGSHADAVADGALRAGMDAARIHAAAELPELLEPLLFALRPGDWVLVKGSRAMRMERIVKAIQDAGNTG